MTLVVQKYGGSSVADSTKIRHVAQRIGETSAGGHQVLVVVSAMGDTTDELIKMAYQVSEQPEKREMDALLSTGELISSTLLTMALSSLGYKAISLSGAQAGIQTDSNYNSARIISVGPKRIYDELQKGNIVIVAGFQGINNGMDTTTLGRGGSDTTAVALAASLGAKECQIYTDVEGIHAADPRVVPGAVKLEEIGYDEMLEMASSGARVMHSRAVELGELYGIPIRVASSFSNTPGTIIRKETAMEVRNRIRGIAHDINVARVSIQGVPDSPGIAAKILEPLAQANVSVDTIIQNASVGNMIDFTFTVGRSDLAEAKKIVAPIVESLGAREAVTDSTLAKVSIIGTGMQNAPGYAALMFRTLYNEGINIQLISTSEIKITCIIAEKDAEPAVRALYKSFESEITKKL
jgi:aspartate kinase